MLALHQVIRHRDRLGRASDDLRGVSRGLAAGHPSGLQWECGSGVVLVGARQLACRHVPRRHARVQLGESERPRAVLKRCTRAAAAVPLHPGLAAKAAQQRHLIIVGTNGPTLPPPARTSDAPDGRRKYGRRSTQDAVAKMRHGIRSTPDTIRNAQDANGSARGVLRRRVQGQPLRCRLGLNGLAPRGAGVEPRRDDPQPPGLAWSHEGMTGSPRAGVEPSRARLRGKPAAAGPCVCIMSRCLPFVEPVAGRPPVALSHDSKPDAWLRQRRVVLDAPLRHCDRAGRGLASDQQTRGIDRFQNLALLVGGR